jgi:anti-sigma factor RsiW
MTAAEHPLAPEDVMAYGDGELAPEQAAVVQAHLEICDECQRVSNDFRGISHDMARWKVEATPATLAAPAVDVVAMDPLDGVRRWLRGPLGFSVTALGVMGALALAVYWPNRIQRMEAFPGRTASYVAPADFPPVSATDIEAGTANLRIAGRVEASRVASESASSRTAAALEARPFGGAPEAVAAPAIARTATLRLQTRDFDAVRLAVDRLTGELQGWYRQVNVAGGGSENRSLTAMLQIPAAKLDDGLGRLKALGTVIGESQTGEDVGDQIIDLDARLSNARNTERRLVDLLQRRTGELEQVLAAEREIARVREQIERFVAQRKKLGDRVTYATLTLEVIETRQATVNFGPAPIGARLREAFVAGVSDAMDAVIGVTLFAARVAPAILILMVVLYLPFRIALGWRRRSAAKS